MDTQTPFIESKTKQIQTQINQNGSTDLPDKLNDTTSHNNVSESKQQLKEEEELQYKKTEKLERKGHYNKQDITEELSFASVDLGTGERKKLKEGEETAELRYVKRRKAVQNGS